MPIKAREVREMLRRENVPPKVIHLLEAYAEELYSQHKAINDLAKLIDQMASTIGMVAGGIFDALDAEHKTNRRLDSEDVVDAPNVTK